MASTFSIDLETVKGFLGYPTGSPSDNSRDTILQLWVDAAIGIVQSLTGRSLAKALYRDTLNMHPQIVMLREYPVSQLVSITVGNSVLTSPGDYQLFADSGRIQFRHHRQYTLGAYSGYDGYGDYLVIDYVGGYDVLPSFLLMAILTGIQAADQAHKQMNNFGGIAKQLTVVDVGSTTFATRATITSAAMQQAISEHLVGFLEGQGQGGLATYQLRETERIGDAPGSP